jgi:hypothetical protein
MKHTSVVVLAVLPCAPAAADAGTLSRLSRLDLDLTDQVAKGIGETVDFGVEGAMLGSVAEGGADAAVQVDLVLGVYADRQVARRRHPTSLRKKLLARALGLQAAPARWPMLARPRFELHVGGVFGLDGERTQLHLATGSGIGPVGVAVAASREWNDAGGAWAMGPELRIRHRFGPGRRTPSVGVVLRGDIFLEERDTHPDRVSLGVFGTFDVL